MFEEKANKTNNKKRKNNQTSLHNYHDTEEQLSQGRIDRINRALLKLFVCYGIPHSGIPIFYWFSSWA